jgi:hypothetical protein
VQRENSRKVWQQYSDSLLNDYTCHDWSLMWITVRRACSLPKIHCLTAECRYNARHFRMADSDVSISKSPHATPRYLGLLIQEAHSPVGEIQVMGFLTFGKVGLLFDPPPSWLIHLHEAASHPFSPAPGVR